MACNNVSAEGAVNPVTLDIVKDSLIAISNEVFYSFARTSMSPIIYETLDYASGIADENGLLLTQGNGACGFIGLIAPMIDEIIVKFGPGRRLPYQRPLPGRRHAPFRHWHGDAGVLRREAGRVRGE